MFKGWWIRVVRCTFLFSVSMTALAPAHAWELAGTKTIVMHARDGQAIDFGSVVFRPLGDGRIEFSIAIDRSKFKDYFLSMREFKCIDGLGEIMCHVPYPYPHPSIITANDFAWLEHGLLFLFKSPAEFGAKWWNGIYFRMQSTEHGLEGTPQAIDLDAISSPPDQPSLPPYRAALRDDLPPGARWASGITIE